MPRTARPTLDLFLLELLALPAVAIFIRATGELHDVHPEVPEVLLREFQAAPIYASSSRSAGKRITQ